jgi:hypothetical protein
LDATQRSLMATFNFLYKQNNNCNNSSVNFSSLFSDWGNMLIVHITIIVRVTFYMSSATIHSTVKQHSFWSWPPWNQFLIVPALTNIAWFQEALVNIILSWVACTFSWSIHKTNFKITKYEEHKNTLLFKQKNLVKHAMNIFKIVLPCWHLKLISLSSLALIMLYINNFLSLFCIYRARTDTSVFKLGYVAII